MKKNREFLKQNKIVFILFTTLYLTIAVTLIILVSLKIMEYYIIINFIMGLITSFIILWSLNYSVKLLIKTENPFYFYFLYLLRIIVYATPLIISLFLFPLISLIGIFLGWTILLMIPFKNFLNIKKGKGV